MAEVANLGVAPAGLDVADLKSQIFNTAGQTTPQPVFNPAGPDPKQQPDNTIIQASPVVPDVQPAAATPAPIEPSPTTEPIDPVELLKKELGLESWDAARAIKTELETLKATPPPTPEHKFTNDESKKIYEHLAAGNKKEVKAYLEAQELLENVATMNDEQQIKLYIKMTNPLYTPKLIDAVYARDYNFDEAKFKDAEGNIADPVAYELAQVDVQQKKQNDTAKAKEYFAQYQSKIELPPIQAAPLTDQKEYQQFQQQKQMAQQVNQEVEERVSKITEKEVSYSYKFNDEASKLVVDVNYTPDADALKSAKDGVINLGDFLNKHFRAADGSPLTAKLVTALAIIQDTDKFVTESIISAVNAERKRFLRDQKNITETGQRQFVPAPPDALQELKNKVFGNN